MSLVAAPPLQGSTIKRQSLRLCHVGLGDSRGAPQVAKLLIAEPSLVKLDLTFNRLGPRGARTIALALPQSNLSVLLLGRNEIGSRGVLALSEVLSSTCISTLDLRLNEIDDAGLESLGKCVATNDKLKRLNLGANRAFTHRGIESFCVSAVYNSHLECLSFSDCGLGNDSLPFLARLVQASNSLQTLDLSSNPRLTNIDGLLDAIKTHSSMRKVVLDGTNVPSEDVERLLVKLNTLHSVKTNIMVLLCATKCLPRLVGTTSLSVLPMELLRLVSEAL
jgi:Ran GTPase-activating protein (RanGAP) involved in mRNA processing and transport